MDATLLQYGALGIMVGGLSWIGRELYKSIQAKDAYIQELHNKRLEDHKALLTTMQENAAASKILADTLEDQSNLIEGLILARENQDRTSVTTANRKKRTT